MLERGAQHALMSPHPVGQSADQRRAEPGEVDIPEFRAGGDLRQPAAALARGEFDQGVEIRLLAFEPAVERADGRARLPAQSLDR
jgi:hypothetical protein